MVFALEGLGLGILHTSADASRDAQLIDQARYLAQADLARSGVVLAQNTFVVAFFGFGEYPFSSDELDGVSAPWTNV